MKKYVLFSLVLFSFNAQYSLAQANFDKFFAEIQRELGSSEEARNVVYGLNNKFKTIQNNFNAILRGEDRRRSTLTHFTDNATVQVTPLGVNSIKVYKIQTYLNNLYRLKELYRNAKIYIGKKIVLSKPEAYGPSGKRVIQFSASYDQYFRGVSYDGLVSGDLTKKVILFEYEVSEGRLKISHILAEESIPAKDVDGFEFITDW